MAAEGFWLSMPRVIEDLVTTAMRKALLLAFSDRVEDQDQSQFDEAG